MIPETDKFESERSVDGRPVDQRQQLGVDRPTESEAGPDSKHFFNPAMVPVEDTRPRTRDTFGLGF